MHRGCTSPAVGFTLTVILSGCYAPPPDFTRPEILRDLHGTKEQQERQLEGRVNDVIGDGVTEDEFIAAFGKRGFEKRAEDDAYPDAVDYTSSVFPCSYNWSLFWEEQDGNITAVNARIGDSCL